MVHSVFAHRVRFMIFAQWLSLRLDAFMWNYPLHCLLQPNKRRQLQQSRPHPTKQNANKIKHGSKCIN